MPIVGDFFIIIKDILLVVIIMPQIFAIEYSLHDAFEQPHYINISSKVVF